MDSRTLFSRVLIAGLIGGALAGCGVTGVQQRLQASADRNILDNTVGQPYADVAAREAWTTEALFGNDKAYGDFFASTELPGGDTVYRHLERSEAFNSSTNVAGLFGSGTTRFDYRLFYFRVGPDGIVKDTANGVVSGEQIKCVSYVGGIFERCGNAELASADMTQMDAMVATSAGLPLSSWE